MRGASRCGALGLLRPPLDCAVASRRVDAWCVDSTRARRALAQVVTKENAVFTKLLVESLGSEDELMQLLPPPFGWLGHEKPKKEEEPAEEKEDPEDPKESTPSMPGGWLLDRAREGLKEIKGIETLKDKQEKYTSESNEDRCVRGGERKEILTESALVYGS